MKRRHLLKSVFGVSVAAVIGWESAKEEYLGKIAFEPILPEKIPIIEYYFCDRIVTALKDSNKIIAVKRNCYLTAKELAVLYPNNQ